MNDDELPAPHLPATAPGANARTTAAREGNAEIVRCPMYWHDHDVRCGRHVGHEPPCVFRHPTGALFVSVRVYREALMTIRSLSPHGVSGDYAYRTVEAIDRL
jgi:hypothetical protein